MMAEKVEMKRTLLQHDLCRIQIFPKPRPDAEKRDTIYLVRALFRYALLIYPPAYTITEADWWILTINKRLKIDNPNHELQVCEKR